MKTYKQYDQYLLQQKFILGFGLKINQIIIQNSS